MPIQPGIEKRGDEGFTITYHYKGERTCYVRLVRVSYTIFYSVRSKTWTVTSPRQMDDELLKAIGKGIDKFLGSIK